MHTHIYSSSAHVSLSQRLSQSPGEIKSRAVELGCRSMVDCLTGSCFLDSVFVTLFHTAVETSVSRVHKLLRTGRVPALTLFFWQWLLVCGLYGLCIQMSYSSLFSPPLSLPLISLTVSGDIKHHDYLLALSVSSVCKCMQSVMCLSSKCAYERFQKVRNRMRLFFWKCVHYLNMDECSVHMILR